MEQFINEIIEARGLPAFIVGMGAILKYFLTVTFLWCGITFFTKK